MEQKVENRKSFRMPFSAGVICHVNENKFKGTIRDLSVSGLFMEATESPSTASNCVIEIVLNGDQAALLLIN